MSNRVSYRGFSRSIRFRYERQAAGIQVFKYRPRKAKKPTKPQLTSTAIYGNDRTSVDRHVRISHSFLRSSLALRSFLFSTRTQLKSFINYKSSPRSPRPFVASFGTGGFQSMTE